MKDMDQLDNLFEQATRPSPVRKEAESSPIERLQAIQGGAPELAELINVQMPALLDATMLLIDLKLNAQRIDGNIIGTGKADYTQDNTFYILNYKDKAFQLIDVPGIEGNESKYEDMVRKAVAKAHLVFYVNGTNKKPEQGTAEKIRGYLRHGTQVCPLINIRGNADAYEFDEDRSSLGKNAGEALKQTVQVLSDILGNKVLLDGHCVQGLLAFTSLAIQSETKQTTIHSSRNYDLVIQQRNYLKYFASAEAMYEFSQIKQVAHILHKKLGTFREDIVESNKVKIRELLSENIVVMEKTLIDYQSFIKIIKPEFDACREGINQAQLSFERLIEAGRKNMWNSFFIKLCEEADDIVAAHFGDNDYISSAIERAYIRKQEELSVQFEDNFTSNFNIMLESIETAMKRLIEDVQRVDFQQRYISEGYSKDKLFSSAKVDKGFEMKDFGWMAVSIGSYVASGAAIGTAFPGIGNLIGAAVGLAIGVLMGLLNMFTSKEKRIRKAQAKIQDSIDDVRRKVMNDLKDDVRSVVEPIRGSVMTKALAQVDDLYANMIEPISIMQQQINLMKTLNKKLENMTYGTVQPI